MPAVIPPNLRIQDSEEILLNDPNLMGLIQRSARLTNACLLIRQRKATLAEKLLAPDKDSENPRLKELVFYLYQYLWIEMGNFAQSKVALLQWLEANPSDLIAISLLQFVITLENEQSVPHQNPSAKPESNAVEKKVTLAQNGSQPDAWAYFQAIFADPNTKFVLAWDQHMDARIETKDASDEIRATEITTLLPTQLQKVGKALEIGSIQKISLMFEKEYLVTWHGEQRHFGLCTKASPQSLVSLARAGRLFQTALNPEENKL